MENVNNQQNYQLLLDKVNEAVLKITKDEKMMLEKLSILERVVIEDKDSLNLEIINKILTSDLDFEEQIYSVLSYGVVADRFKKIGKLSNEEIIMVSFATMYVEADDYTFYAGVLSDPSVSKAIVDTDPDLINQVEVAYSIMENQHNYYGEDITPDNFDLFVEEAVNIASKKINR